MRGGVKSELCGAKGERGGGRGMRGGRRGGGEGGRDEGGELQGFHWLNIGATGQPHPGLTQKWLLVYKAASLSFEASTQDLLLIPSVGHCHILGPCKSRHVNTRKQKHVCSFQPPAFLTLRHHVQDVVHHCRTQLQIKMALHALLSHSLGHALWRQRGGGGRQSEASGQAEWEVHTRG